MRPRRSALKKVISEHSTIGIVVTTDGSISEIPRSDYLEGRGAGHWELQALGKPFMVLLNSKHPREERTLAISADITSRYGVTCLPVNCQTLSEEDVAEIIKECSTSFR